jgi:hypothetical protein
MLLSGCTQNEDFDCSSKGVISIHARIDNSGWGTETRADGVEEKTAFEDGDIIGVNGSGILNVPYKYVAETDSWVPATDRVVSYNAINETFTAYYPYDENVKDSVLTEIKDYLFSKTTSSIYDKGEGIDVTFTFKHVMCKALVNVMRSQTFHEGGMSGNGGSTIFFDSYTMELINVGSFNITSGVAIADEATTPIKIVTKNNSDILFFPQNSEITVYVECYGDNYKAILEDYSYEREGGLRYKGGRYYYCSYANVGYNYYSVVDKKFASKCDYVLDDGTILINYEGYTTYERYSDRIVGMVFWTEKEKGEDCDVSLTADSVLMRHFPQCTHGLIVSAKSLQRDYKITMSYGYSYATTSAQMNWQGRTAGEILYDSNNGIDTEDDEFEYIDEKFRESTSPYNISSLYRSINNNKDLIGYNNTEILKAYNKSAKNYVRPVKALTDAIEDGTLKNIPGCSSWYIPSIRELLLILGIEDMHEPDDEVEVNSFYTLSCYTYSNFSLYQRLWSSSELNSDMAICIDKSMSDYIKVLAKEKNDGANDESSLGNSNYGCCVFPICAF